MTANIPTSPIINRLYPMHVAVQQGKKYYWCSCGMSATQPWCDGSHKGTDMKPIEWVAPSNTKYNFCMCKQSKTKPICNLTHLTLIRQMHGVKIAVLSVMGVGFASAVWKVTHEKIF